MTTIFEWVAQQAWECLRGTVVRLMNPVFMVLIVTQAALTPLLDVNVTFAEGLLDVVQSSSAPGLDFFSSLPSDLLRLPLASKYIGVYVVLLEKEGSRFKIYIGSGIGLSGIYPRMYQYDRYESLPNRMYEAIRDGYEITHKGLLCWSPLPKATTRLAVRVLFRLLEATFTCVFWAMVSRQKHYGMPLLCPWPLESLLYDGLCTHTPLLEAIPGEDGGFSPEQIAAQEAAEKARKAEQEALTQTWLKANRDTRRYPCDLCGFAFPTKSNLEEHCQGDTHKNKVAGIEKPPPKDAFYSGWAQNNIAKKRYHCKYCNYTPSTQQKLDVHNAGDKHKDAVKAAGGVVKPTKPHPGKVRDAKAKAAKTHYCEACDYAARNRSTLLKHFTRNSHKENVKALEALKAKEPGV
ncbi:hypothetical protein KC349_g6957 [Hortaea werneckii]|nr:hypothetical protein KC349_g6957 [Hortaea werneckii]